MNETNNYLVLKEKQQGEINAFPLIFAFDEKQLAEGMAKRGLKPEETDKLYSIGCGGYVKKTDAKALHEMMNRHDRELRDAIKANENDFVYKMFRYELANHEYCICNDWGPTFDALGLTHAEVMNDEKLKDAFKRAEKCERGW